MSRINDLSRSFTAFEQDNTLIVVVEISLSSWLVAGILPGVARQPLKKLVQTKMLYWLSSTAGRTKLPEPAAPSRAFAWLTRRDVTVSGWRAGFGLTTLKRTSFIPRASAFPASIDEQRPTGSIQNCSSVLSLDG